MFLKKYTYTIGYIILIILLNMAFSYVPFYQVWGYELSPMDSFVGLVYLLRDLSQRELGHYIFAAMIIGAIASYFLADPKVALASISAFMVGELVDWLVFTFSKRPLKDRLLWSATLSTPVDSMVFLWVIGRFNPLALLIMTLGKMLGVAAIWAYYHRTAIKLFFRKNTEN